MKRKLFNASIIALSALAMVGCTPKDDGSSMPSNNQSSEKPSETKEAKIAYQFTGNYTDDTLTSMGYNYFVLLNLYEDGKVLGSGYNQLSMDTSPYASNDGFSEKWYNGTWENKKNDEDISYIYIDVKYGKDAVDMQTGNKLTIKNGKYEAYAKKDGTMTFEIDVPFASGRTTDVTGSSNIKYQTLDDFIKGNEYKWTEPEYLGKFESKEDAYANLYIQDKGVAKFYKGIEDKGTKTYKYLANDTWSWSLASNVITFTKEGQKVADATIAADNKASFEYTYSFYGMDTKYKFNCLDTSKIKEENGVQPELIETIASFYGKNDSGEKTDDSLEVYDNNTAKVSAFNKMLNVNLNWSIKAADKIEFVDAVNSEKKYEATITDNKAELTFQDSMMGNSISVNFVCDDISKVLQTVSVQFKTSDGGATLDMSLDKKAVMKAFSGMLNVNFTWVYTKGTPSLVFTDAVDNSKTINATLEGNKATVNYSASLGGNEVELALVCEDISPITSLL